tara:strand:+ start:5513 stop:6043 length:531 start_codon:yes stop_codon:yes gene_type:complete
VSKFKTGETSKNVLDKKNKITKSILLKAKILDQIDIIDDIPTSLMIKGRKISEVAIHKWHDEELNICAYSRNTAYADHNANALKTLLSAINNANQRIINSDTSSREYKFSSNASYDSLTDLREENEMLRSALAEVYRAYMQLIEKNREDKHIDEAYRTMILDQSRILGRHRFQMIK